MGSSGADQGFENATLTSRWIRQGLLNVAYLCTALCVFSRGPTLLDLQEIYGVDTSTISKGFVTFSIGDIIGCPIVGFFMNRFQRYNFFIMFVSLVGMALTHGALPFLGNIYLFQLISGLSGAFNGAIHTGFNALCLYIWRGLNGGPPMQSLYLSYAIGGVVASLASKPFLGGQDLTHGESRVDLLFLLIGAFTLVSSIGFLWFGVQDCVTDSTGMLDPKKAPSSNSKAKDSKEQPDATTALLDSQKTGKSHSSFVEHLFFVLIFITIVTNISFETAIPNYLPTFAVELGHSKQDGVTLLAIFFASYCLFRMVGILLAVKIKPGRILVLDYSLCLASCLVLSVLSQNSLSVLQVTFAVLGIGSGSINATVWTWLEQHLPPTSVVVGVLVLAGGIGNLLVPVIVGNFIDQFPLVLVYYLLALSVIGAAALAVSALAGTRLRGTSM